MTEPTSTDGAPKASNLTMRLATAAVAGPAILALLYFGPAWGWLALVSAAAAIGSVELFGMTHPGDRFARAAGLVLTLGVIGVLWQWGFTAKVLLSVLLGLPFVSLFLVLGRVGDMNTAALRVMVYSFGPLYLGGGLGAVVLLRRDGGSDGASFVVLALMLSWLSDTGAYFAGRAFGKHKLYEAVSPKKTVEGALGGLAGAVAGALFAHFVSVKSLPLVDALVLAIVGGALGQAGDLGESLLKRSVGVKDSGGIVPGHGGILDRVDALVVTGTVTYLYLVWVRL